MKLLHLCRDNLRRGQSRNHKVWWEEADRKSGLRAVMYLTGPLLYLRGKDVYSLKKPNQRAVITTFGH